MSTNPTMDTELEGYNKNGSPGLLRNKGGAMKSKRRAKGGALPEALKKRDEEEEEKAHHKARKAGGKVDGKMPMMRPDKRARGGAAEGDTSDEKPLTSAGKMEHKPFEEEGQEGDGEGGEGADKDPKQD
jgi:hypothetical protein